MEQLGSVLASGPRVRGSVVHGMRGGAVALWGEGVLAQLAPQLSADTRHDTIDAPILLSDAWFPERYVVEWMRAAWEGPCRREQGRLLRFVARYVDHGIGRVRRLLLSMVGPPKLIEQAEMLWRHEHSSGTLTAACSEDSVVVRLSNHLYTHEKVMQLALGETFRHLIGRCRGVRVAQLTEEGLDSTGDFIVGIRWR
jgi:hypothetical protein